LLSKIVLLLVKFKEVMGESARSKLRIYASKTNFIIICLKRSERSRESENLEMSNFFSATLNQVATCFEIYVS
jgi:hypothetical protein